MSLGICCLGFLPQYSLGHCVRGDVCCWAWIHSMVFGIRALQSICQTRCDISCCWCQLDSQFHRWSWLPSSSGKVSLLHSFPGYFLMSETLNGITLCILFGLTGSHGWICFHHFLNSSGTIRCLCLLQGSRNQEQDNGGNFCYVPPAILSMNIFVSDRATSYLSAKLSLFLIRADRFLVFCS